MPGEIPAPNDICYSGYDDRFAVRYCHGANDLIGT